MMTSEEIERLAASLHKMGVQMGGRDFGDPRRGAVLLAFDPTPPTEGDRDPWQATLYGHQGVGQTAEMALLQLRENLVAALSATVAEDERRVAEIQARIAFVKDVAEPRHGKDGT